MLHISVGKHYRVFMYALLYTRTRQSQHFTADILLSMLHATAMKPLEHPAIPHCCIQIGTLATFITKNNMWLLSCNRSHLKHTRWNIRQRSSRSKWSILENSKYPVTPEIKPSTIRTRNSSYERKYSKLECAEYPVSSATCHLATLKRALPNDATRIVPTFSSGLAWIWTRTPLWTSLLPHKSANLFTHPEDCSTFKFEPYASSFKVFGCLKML